MFVVFRNMDSSRVLLAIQEKLRWEGRKARIEEKLSRIREKKIENLRLLEEVRRRIAQLTATSGMMDSDRQTRDIAVRIEGLR